MKERGQGYFQVSLMNVFRQAARERDAKAGGQVVDDDDARVLSMRSIERREGAGEETLRQHLANDLGNLLGTIHLEAVEDLADFEHVRNSVLNYGMRDMTRLTTSDIGDIRLARDLRAALLSHEPRLIDQTVAVKLRSSTEDENQRVSFDITAEMSARPVDVPLEFVAEIDVGAGKVALADLTVRG